MSPKFQMN